MPDRLFSAVRALATCLRSGVRAAREAVVRSRIMVQSGQGPRVAFLPAYGRHGAALLRIYNVAEALRPLGWQVLVVPWRLTLAQRQRVLRAFQPDALVMQGARHGLNRPGLYPQYPILYDLDDADFHLPHLAEPSAQAMGQVACVLAGSTYIAEWCRARGAAAEVVWTGTPVTPAGAPPQEMRPPVVA